MDASLAFELKTPCTGTTVSQLCFNKDCLWPGSDRDINPFGGSGQSRTQSRRSIKSFFAPVVSIFITYKTLLSRDLQLGVSHYNVSVTIEM